MALCLCIFKPILILLFINFENMTNKTFASDNYSSVHPEVMQALIEANTEHAKAYGNDEYTKKAKELIKAEFGNNVDIYFVFTGTAANVLSLKACVKPYQSIICADSSHLNVNETGAPEAITGSKLITIKNENGKISLESIKARFEQELSNAPHSPRPRVVSIAQTTEYGTIYSPEEIKQIAEFCKENGMYLHMDGCRIYNAAAKTNKTLRELSVDCGVDIMSIGGTKNGLMFAEAVLIFNDELKKDFQYLQKQGLQLYSKMRYLSVQYIPFFENKLWLKNAEHANKMTDLLFEKLKEISEIQITKPVESNHIFAIFPKEIIEEIQKNFYFYVWDNLTNEVRLVTSFDTTEDDVNKFVENIKYLLKR